MCIIKLADSVHAHLKNGDFQKNDGSAVESFSDCGNAYQIQLHVVESSAAALTIDFWPLCCEWSRCIPGVHIVQVC